MALHTLKQWFNTTAFGQGPDPDSIDRKAEAGFDELEPSYQTCGI